MNVKPGDLAVVVNLRGCWSPNNGMIVKVERAVLCTCNASAWDCKSEGRPFVGESWLGEISRGPTAAVHDENLRPVSGLLREEDVDQAIEAFA